MSEFVMASSEADVNAAETLKRHHAVLAGSLRLRTEALFAASSHRGTAVAETARRDLVDCCERELVPYERAEEQATYPAAPATVEGRLLVEGMLGEHEDLIRLPGEVAEAADPRRVAASATMHSNGDPRHGASVWCAPMREPEPTGYTSYIRKHGDDDALGRATTMTALARAHRRTGDGSSHPFLVFHADASLMADARRGLQRHALTRGREWVGCHV